MARTIGTRSDAKAPALLAGGNPRIAKADGDAPVQAWIAALPGWKREAAARLDALVVQNVPGVCKAVKWNSPLYGIEGQGWFLGLHAFTHYLKLAFFRGSALQPPPPGASKSGDTRYLDVREGDPLDTAQLARWLKQAAALPGFAGPGRGERADMQTGPKSAPSNNPPKQRGADRMSKTEQANQGASPSEMIDARIEELGDWRGKTLAHVRGLVKKALPDVVEEWKWRGVPTWYHDGKIVCTGETYKAAVKLTFAKGAALDDPSKLFNASLEGNARRAIDIHEGDKVDDTALKALLRAAAALNKPKGK